MTLPAIIWAILAWSLVKGAVWCWTQERIRRRPSLLPPLRPMAEYLGDDIPFLDVTPDKLRPIKR
jgi:hypothetical protein